MTLVVQAVPIRFQIFIPPETSKRKMVSQHVHPWLLLAPTTCPESVALKQVPTLLFFSRKKRSHESTHLHALLRCLGPPPRLRGLLRCRLRAVGRPLRALLRGRKLRLELLRALQSRLQVLRQEHVPC